MKKRTDKEIDAIYNQYAEQVRNMSHRAQAWMRRNGNRKPQLTWKIDPKRQVVVSEAIREELITGNASGMDLLRFIVQPYNGKFEPTMAMAKTAVGYVCKKL